MNTRSILKWIALIASAIWMSVTTYQEFLDVDPTQFGFRSSEVEAQMKGCGGSFQQRYDCKEEIIIAKGYESFLVWVEKSTFVLGPPLMLALVLGWSSRDKAPNPERSFDAKRPLSVAKRRVR
jgi:hypothetical protein